MMLRNDRGQFLLGDVAVHECPIGFQGEAEGSPGRSTPSTVPRAVGAVGAVDATSAAKTDLPSLPSLPPSTRRKALVNC